MILAFKQKLNGKPSYFVEKIWQSLPTKLALDSNYFIGGLMRKNYKFSDDAYDMPPKLHTIRKDSSNRWKAGNDIHFTINSRQPNQFQFAPVVKCISVQTIEIKNIFCDRYCVKINGRKLKKKEVKELAINDGFKNSDDFWNYFEYSDFQGKLIHWTDLKY